MVLDQVGHAYAAGRDGANGRLFAIAHEAAVAFHVRAEDGR